MFGVAAVDIFQRSVARTEEVNHQAALHRLLFHFLRGRRYRSSVVKTAPGVNAVDQPPTVDNNQDRAAVMTVTRGHGLNRRHLSSGWLDAALSSVGIATSDNGLRKVRVSPPWELTWPIKPSANDLVENNSQTPVLNDYGIPRMTTRRTL